MALTVACSCSSRTFRCQFAQHAIASYWIAVYHRWRWWWRRGWTPSQLEAEDLGVCRLDPKLRLAPRFNLCRGWWQGGPLQRHLQCIVSNQRNGLVEGISGQRLASGCVQQLRPHDTAHARQDIEQQHQFELRIAEARWFRRDCHSIGGQHTQQSSTVKAKPAVLPQCKPTDCNIINTRQWSD